MDIWKTWTELKDCVKDKDIVLWGRSEDWIHKTLPKLPKKPKYIVDRNKGYWGQTFMGFEVRKPHVSWVKENVYIVITAGPYESVADDLLAHGFIPGEDFCCSPAYYDFKLIKELHNYEQQVLISSPDYPTMDNHRYSKSGGGLYLYTIGPNTVEKVLPGHFRQMIEIDSLIWAVEYVEGRLCVIEKDSWKIKKTYPLDYPNACGITYWPEGDLIFIANVAKDEVYAIERKDYLHTGTTTFHKPGKHHINDICFNGNSLYISYFSFSGNWRKGIMDGGIQEMDCSNGFADKAYQLMSGLWMPHSVEYINGNLCFLDSMRGNLYIGSNIEGHFHGFVRGLAHDGRFYYIGQSEDMYMSRLFGKSQNIMMNAGFYLFDSETKVSRFYPMLDTVNIHDILII